MSAEEIKQQGDELHRQGNYREAYKKYTEAIEKTPNNAVLYANRAETCLKLRNYLDALSDAQQATKLDPWNTKSWRRAAISAENLRYWQTARHAYLSAISSLDSSSLSPEHRTLFRGDSEAGFARATAAQEANLPWNRAKTFAMENRLKRGRLPSSGWVVLVAAAWFEKGYREVQGMGIHTFGFSQPFSGIGVQYTMGRALEGLTSGLIGDPRAFKVDEGFLDKMEVQIRGEIFKTGAWTTLDIEKIKSDVVQRLPSGGWDPVRRALAVTVRIWIFLGFIASQKGNHAEAVGHYKRTIDLLQWGTRKYANVHRMNRGAHFEPSFIRGIQRLNLQSTIAWHLQDGSALGPTLDDIERLAQELKCDTEAAAPFPDIEGEPGFYAPFWIYPIAESLCALGWVQQRRAAERLGTSMSENVAELSKAAQFYMTAATTYPLDEEERPFSLYMAFEILCRAKSSLRLILPLCGQIKEAMAAADVIWDGTRLRLETEAKAANCRRAIGFLEDCQKKIAAGSLTLDDVVSPVFVRGL